MKSDNKNQIKVKVRVDKDLKKYAGKNLSEMKTVAFKENIEQIKSALDKHLNIQVY